MANFNFTFQPGVSSEQIVGFEMAGRIWSQYLQDDAVFNVHVAKSDELSPTVVGGALPVYVTTDIATVQNAMGQDATSPDDATALANLNSQIDVDGSTQYSTILNDTFYQSSDLSITHANAKALGLEALVSPSSLDGYVLFNSLDNSSFTWDYDFSRTSASSSSQVDFLSMALHELGHIMGFISGVDVIGDITNQANLDKISLLDLFRYSDRSTERRAREMTPGQAAYFSIDGGQTQVAPMAAGLTQVLGGIEGYQASHWAYQPPANANLMPEVPEFDLTTALIDLIIISAPVTARDAQLAEAFQIAEFVRRNEIDVGAQTSTTILENVRQATYNSLGIMDPALVPGFRSNISTLDLQALDVIGYNLGDLNFSLDYAALLQEAQTALAQKVGVEVGSLDESLGASTLIQDRQANLSEAITSSQSLFERRRSSVRTRRWVFWQEDGLDPAVVNIVSDGAGNVAQIAALEGSTQVTTVQAIPYAQLFFRSDTAIGSDVNDYIFPVLPVDEVITIDAGSGNNFVFLGDFSADATTGEGDDTVVGVSLRDSNQNSNQNTGKTSTGVDYIVDAGLGNNYVLLTSETGSVKVSTGTGNDYILVGSSDTVVETSGGDNEIYSSALVGVSDIDVDNNGIDSLISNADLTTVSFSSILGSNQISTGDGNDSIYLISKESTVNTTGGNNVIHIQGPGDSRSSLNTGDGNDEIILVGSSGIVDAGDGNNVVTITGNFDASNRTPESPLESFLVTTGDGNDVVRLKDSLSSILTGEGDDIVDAIAGQHSITTGIGNDLIILGDLQGAYTRFGTQTLITDFSEQDTLLLHGSFQDYEIASNSLFYRSQQLATFEAEIEFSIDSLRNSSQVIFTETNLGTNFANSIGTGPDVFAKPRSPLEESNNSQPLQARYNTLREERPLRYAITGGDDAALFSINPITGVVQFKSAPDSRSPLDSNEDNIYDVLVQATLGEGQERRDIDTQRLSIAVSSSANGSIDLSETQSSSLPRENQGVINNNSTGFANTEFTDSLSSEDSSPISPVTQPATAETSTQSSTPSNGEEPLENKSLTKLILGDNAENVLRGTAEDDVIQAAGGNDAIVAGAGDDRISPTDEISRGAGETDYVDLGTGQDVVVLGDKDGSYYIAKGWADSVYIDGFTYGEDQLVLSGSATQYQVTADADGSWILLGNDSRTAITYLSGVTSFDLMGSSVIYIESSETNGSETNGSEITTSNFSSVTVSATDTNIAVVDNNSIQGSIGNDALVGTLSNDQLLGIGGIDYLEGGAGADQFVLGDANGSFYAQAGWNDSAYIEDFEVGVDQLVLGGSEVNYTIQSDGQGAFLYEGDDYIAYLKGVTNVDLSAVKYVS